jgi:hypothetical protein
MMQSLRDSSQQDRRVYVGNLSYDVKWHHLKDFMRQGQSLSPVEWVETILQSANRLCSGRCPVCRRFTTSEWNVEGGRQHMRLVLFGFGFVWNVWIDGWDLVRGICRDVGKSHAALIPSVVAES